MTLLLGKPSSASKGALPVKKRKINGRRLRQEVARWFMRTKIRPVGPNRRFRSLPPFLRPASRQLLLSPGVPIPKGDAGDDLSICSLARDAGSGDSPGDGPGDGH